MEESNNAQPVAESTGTQVCKECGRTLPLEEFQRRRYGKRDKVCKACRAEKIRVGMATGKEKKECGTSEQKPELPLMGGDTDTYFDDLRMTTKPLTSREWFNEGIKYAQRLQKEQKPEVMSPVTYVADLSDGYLLEELRRRGYKGKLAKVQEVEI